MTAPPDRSGTSNAKRIQGYGVTSTALALRSDRRLGELLDATPLLASGIGGTSALLDIDGTQVFAKRIPLTDLERRPGNVMSTANMFDLPTFCQYGVGAPGFGVWREVVANVMTTNWVLTRQNESFPLMYHWRVLDGPSRRPRMPDDLAERDRTVEYWHDSAAIGYRLDAIARASASVVLFLEYVPQNLHEWLKSQLAIGDDTLEAACAMLERSLRHDVSFMNANGLVHFDAHFQNILTDGHRLYYADLGLATSPRFELSADEAEFLKANESHDGCYAMTQLVNWLAYALTDAHDAAERNAYIRRCAEGKVPSDVPAWAATIIGRYAPVVVVMNDFYWDLFGESRKTPYPVEAVERACAETGFEPVMRVR
jgi:hypothetical protein